MLVRIVDDVRDWFILRGLSASVVDGIECRNEQTNYGSGGRVAFVPSRDPVAVTEPTHIGEDASGRRQLLNTLFAFDVSFDGYDEFYPDRDLAHRQVCFDLFEATVQAVQRTYFGAHAWGSARWSDDRKHARRGAELIATLTLNVPVFDIEYPLAAPGPVPDAKPDL